MVQPWWKAVWKVLQKLEIELSCDPALPPLGIYPEKFRALVGKDRCTPAFIVVVFTVAKLRKQPQCPSAEEWTSRHGP